MLEDTVMYNGLPIKKAHFRAFVYGMDKTEKLVNSWYEYEDALATGDWFSRKQDVPERPVKPRRKQGD